MSWVWGFGYEYRSFPFPLDIPRCQGQDDSQKHPISCPPPPIVKSRFTSLSPVPRRSRSDPSPSPIPRRSRNDLSPSPVSSRERSEPPPVVQLRFTSFLLEIDTLPCYYKFKHEILRNFSLMAAIFMFIFIFFSNMTIE